MHTKKKTSGPKRRGAEPGSKPPGKRIKRLPEDMAADTSKSRGFPPEIIVESREELLHFDDQKRLTRVIRKDKKQFCSGLQLCFSSLKSLQVYDQFMRYFDNVGWSKFFTLHSLNMYAPLCEEFMVSFNLKKMESLDDTCISFRLGLHPVSLNLTEWNVALGLISPEDITSPVYADAFVGTYKDFPDFNPVDAWKLLAPDCPFKYDSTCPKSCNVHWISDPVLRLCCHYILRNVFGRSTTFSRVSQPALFVLWCMLRKEKLNLGYWLADSLHTIANDHGRHMTLCTLVGVLLDNSVNLTVPPSFTLLPEPTLFDLDYMEESNLVYLENNVYKFYESGLPNSSTASSSRAGRVTIASVHEEVQALHNKLDSLLAQNDFIRHQNEVIMKALGITQPGSPS